MDMMQRQVDFVGPPDLQNKAGTRVGNKVLTSSTNHVRWQPVQRYRLKHLAASNISYWVNGN